VNKKTNLTIGVNLNTEKLRKFAEMAKSEYSIRSISLNKGISRLLIGKPTANFSKEIIDWLSEKIKEIKEKPILITDIDILFELSFQLDPLTIFKQLSRNSSLLVLWSGEYKNNTLSYASPEHAHYRTWADPGVEIIQV